jgi:hypothetical protein
MLDGSDLTALDALSDDEHLELKGRSSYTIRCDTVVLHYESLRVRYGLDPVVVKR